MTTMDNNYYHKYLKYKTKYNKLLNNDKIYLARIKNNNSNDKNDMDKIIAIANNVQILGMAEATHGQNIITKFRINIFKNLVEKCGYTVFILEDQYSCCEKINQYIHGKKGDINKLMMDLVWFWQSVSMLKLIEWMKKYNIKYRNILEFRGIDIQSLCKSNKSDKIAEFAKKKNRLNKKVDQDNWVKADGYRDKSMFDVFMKIYDPSKKYFIYAHNYHIAKMDLVGSGTFPADTESEGRLIRGDESVDWLGCLLFKKFNNQYYAIGNVFLGGSYLETFDLVQQKKDSGFDIIYQKIGNSNFIAVEDVPAVGKINIDKLTPGLTIYKNATNRPFDAIMTIASEKPLKLTHYV